MKTILIMTLIVLSLFSCSKGGDERLAEQEGIKSQQQIEALRDYEDSRTAGSESRLNKIKHFIQATSGVFFGEVEINSVRYEIRLELESKDPIFFYDRTRTKEEIEKDQEGIYYVAQIKMLDLRVGEEEGAIPCTVVGKLPDYENGTVSFTSEKCSNSFKVSLSDNMVISDAAEMITRAKELSNEVISNQIEQVDILTGVISPGISMKDYIFKLKRL